MAITALSGIFFLGVIATVTDVGYIYYNQSKLQTAVNAAWKAGFDKMIQIKSSGTPVLTSGDRDVIKQHIIEVIKANGYSDEDAASMEIIFEPNNHLTLRSKKRVGLFFARALDINSAEVSAGRANMPGDSGSGIVPLAIPHGVAKDVSPTKYRYDAFEGEEKFAANNEYLLKLGEDDLQSSGDVAPWGIVAINNGENFGYTVGTEYILKQSPATDPLSPGNFGCLDLDGSQGGGANDYYDWIINGYNGTLSIGNLVYPQTGNIAGKTVDGVQYRLDNGMINIRIPVVSGFGNGSSSQVEIIGFLNFRLTGHGLEEGKKGGSDKATVRAIFTGLVDNETGKPKKSFGRTDPDNIATNTSQYVDNLKYGFNAPIDFGNMILPENGNASQATTEAVNFRLDPANAQYASRTVIVPITEVPSEIGVNNPANLNAETIYDLDANDSPGGIYNIGDYAFGSSVRIIGFAEFEILPENEYSRVGKNYDSGDSGDLGPVQPGQVRGRFLRYIIEPGTVPLN